MRDVFVPCAGGQPFSSHALPVVVLWSGDGERRPTQALWVTWEMKVETVRVEVVHSDKH